MLFRCPGVSSCSIDETRSDDENDIGIDSNSAVDRRIVPMVPSIASVPELGEAATAAAAAADEYQRQALDCTYRKWSGSEVKAKNNHNSFCFQAIVRKLWTLGIPMSSHL